MNIGTRNESSLHKALKIDYSGDGAEIEAYVSGFVCDAVSKSGTVIEVQTGSFAPLRKKLKVLLKNKKVQIIYPVILNKTIEKYDMDGELISRRKSPRKGSIWDVFSALVYAPEIMSTKGIELVLALVDVNEMHINDGKGSWRRKGFSIKDRVISSNNGMVVLLSKKDYLQFIPFNKKEQWTAKELAEKAKIHPALARKTVFVLTKTGLIARNKKCGNAYLYQRNI